MLMVLNRVNTKILALAGAVAIGVLLAGCGEAAITGDTTCREYLTHTQQERADAATQLSVQLHATDPGNPMWAFELDSWCGSSPDKAVRSAFGK